jgi:hypothetical protein
VEVIEAQQKAVGRGWSAPIAKTSDGSGTLWFGTGAPINDPNKVIRNVIYLDRDGNVFLVPLKDLENIKIVGLPVPIADVKKGANVTQVLP